MKWLAITLCAFLLCACVKNKRAQELGIADSSMSAQVPPPTIGPEGGEAPPPPPPPPLPPTGGEVSSVYRVLIQGRAVATAFAVVTANPKLTGYSVLVTAAHALGDVPNDSSSSLSLEGPKKTVIPVIRHATSKEIDAAVLIVKTPLPALAVGGPAAVDAPCRSENYSVFPPMTTNPRILSKGYIVETDGENIWAFLMPFAQGGSGAALMVGGAVVGLVNQKVLDGNNYPTGIVHAINMQSVMRFIDSIR